MDENASEKTGISTAAAFQPTARCGSHQRRARKAATVAAAQFCRFAICTT